MGEIPNIPQGKKVIERTTADGKKEYIVRNDPNYGGPDCWLATAYFGDPLHPDVVLLRRWRDSRIAGRSDQEIGKVLVRLANTAYLSLGFTDIEVPSGWKLRVTSGDAAGKFDVIGVKARRVS